MGRIKLDKTYRFRLYISAGQPPPLHKLIGQIQTGGSGAVSETVYADDARQRTP